MEVKHIYMDITITWWLIAIAGAVLIFEIYMIIKHIRNLRKITWIFIPRLLAVLATTFLLFRPEIVRISEQTKKPALVILRDSSESMTTRDIKASLQNPPQLITRGEWVAKQLEDKNLLHRLEQKYRVVITDFSPAPTSSAVSVQEEAGTDLGGALESVMRNYRDVRAVLLMSDGDWNIGTSPLTPATKLKIHDIPVFSVVVGSEKHLPDIELLSIRAPAYGFVDEHITIPFVIQSWLPREVKTTVTLKGETGVEFSRNITIPPMSTVQNSVILVPRNEGDFNFTINVPVEPEEVLQDNNIKQFRMSFRREVIKVLVVESTPRWEFRFLKNALSRDPGVRVNCLLKHRGIESAEGLNYISHFPQTKAELSQYDVVFLGDVGIGPDGITTDDAEMLKGLVEQQGSGLVFLPGILGKQITLINSPLGELMPVVLDTSSPSGFGFGLESKLLLTPRGNEHLITMLDPNPERNREIWNALPGFYWHAAVIRSKAGSEVLAVHSTARNQYGRLPLLVTRSCGKGKVLFLGTDGVWRWRRGVEDTYHYRFWAQVTRWMSHQRHLAYKEGFRFFYLPEIPKRGEKIYMYATVMDTSGAPLKSGTVRAIISSQSGYTEKIILTPEPGEWGGFAGSFVPQSSGPHKVLIEAPDADKKLETTIEVLPHKREVIGQPANANILQEIANITGGKCVSTDMFDSLINSIELLPKQKPVKTRIPLWCHPGVLIIIAGLFGLYWIFRKLAGLI